MNSIYWFDFSKSAFYYNVCGNYASEISAIEQKIYNWYCEIA